MSILQMKFEAWAVREGYSLEKSDNGIYLNYDTLTAFGGFEAGIDAYKKATNHLQKQNNIVVCPEPIKRPHALSHFVQTNTRQRYLQVGEEKMALSRIQTQIFEIIGVPLLDRI